MSEIMTVVYFFFIFSSLIHLLIISLDRLSAVCAPIRHRVVVTRGRIHVAIALLWLSVTFFTAAIFVDAFSGREKGHRHKVTRRTSTFIAITVLIVDALFVATNSVMICVIRKKPTFIENEQGHSKSKSTEHAVQIVCGVVTVLFIVFTAPWALLESINSGRNCTHLLLIMNSGVNSLAYFFKGYISRLLRLCTKKHEAA